MRIEGVSTHELRDGDIVLVHGMRVRLDGRGRVSVSHPVSEHSPVLWWPGVVLNLPEVLAAGFIPAGWVKAGVWTIQGNGLARWDVERG